MCSLSVGLLMMFVMCFIPICVALSFIGVYPRPIFLVDVYIASVGKLGVSPREFLAALLRILSIVSSYLSVKMPRWVAWYLDLSSWSITSSFRLGDSNLRVRILARFLMFAVICLRWSLKSSMGLMCTPRILYDLFGGRYWMGVSSSDLIVLI